MASFARNVASTFTIAMKEKLSHSLLIVDLKQKSAHESRGEVDDFIQQLLPYETSGAVGLCIPT